MVYLTADLLDVLLEEAAERDPGPVTIELAVTRAGEFDDLDLPPETPVFTTFYPPDAGRSLEAVFGSKLGTPAGATQGLFVSHPAGDVELRRSDDLREVILVAVPPWDRDSVVAFGRDGARRPLEVVDAVPPEESLPREP